MKKTVLSFFLLFCFSFTYSQCSSIYGMVYSTASSKWSLVSVDRYNGNYSILDTVFSLKYLVDETSTIEPDSNRYVMLGIDTSYSSLQRIYTINFYTGQVLYQPVCDSQITNLHYDIKRKKIYALLQRGVYPLYQWWLVTINPYNGSFSLIDSITGMRTIVGETSTIGIDSSRYYVMGLDNSSIEWLYALDETTGQIKYQKRDSGIVELQYDTISKTIYCLSDSEDIYYAHRYFLNSINPSTNSDIIMDSIPYMRDVVAWTSAFAQDSLRYFVVGSNSSYSINQLIYTINSVTGNTLMRPVLGSGTINYDATEYAPCNTGYFEISINATNVSCDGGNNATATVTAYDGTAPYTYLWSPSGETIATATGLTAGSYTVSVTDGASNTAMASVYISQPDSLNADISTLTNVTCNGGNNGSIVSTPSGGAAPYKYLWSNGETNSTLTGLSTGTYSITITDQCGDIATSVVTITQPTVITITHDSVTSSVYGCTGIAAVTASGGTPPYTYLWSAGGQTTDTIKNQCAGNYCCAITDNNGCSQTTCITISNCVNNYDEPICIATVDTANNKAEIIWGRTNSPPAGGYGYYIVIKYSSFFWSPIDSVALDSLSEYIDTSSNPSAGPVSYELATVDSCGESALSAPHTTIYLTTTAGVNAIILNWTAYVGFTPSKYRIFRGPALNAMVQIDSVASSILTYTDSFPPAGSVYAVEAVNPAGVCVPTTHSAYTHSGVTLSGSFSNGFNTATLGVQNIIPVNNLNIYPNPSKGIFTVQLSSVSSNPDSYRESVEVYNMFGQEVYSNSYQLLANGNQPITIDLSNEPSGIYSLRMQTNNGIAVRKIVIMGNK